MGVDIDGLDTADRDELLEYWRSLIGRPPPKHISRSLLIQILAFELQSKHPKKLSLRLTRAGLHDTLRQVSSPVIALCASIAVRPMLLRWQRMTALCILKASSAFYQFRLTRRFQ